MPPRRSAVRVWILRHNRCSPLGPGLQLKGPSVIIDSTGQTTLDPTAILDGTSVSIASGQISLALTDPGNLQSGGGLVLSGTALQSLQSGAQTLSLLSYSSIDTYGAGQIGQNTLANLAIHAAEIRGFNQGERHRPVCRAKHSPR